jgi:hypothetical protein
VSDLTSTTAEQTSAHADDDRGSEEELVMFLERDQLAVDTARPLPRAPISRRAHIALWALRVFVTVVSAMVIYTFVSQVVH